MAVTGVCGFNTRCYCITYRLSSTFYYKASSHDHIVEIKLSLPGDNCSLIFYFLKNEFMMVARGEGRVLGDWVRK